MAGRCFHRSLGRCSGYVWCLNVAFPEPYRRRGVRWVPPRKGENHLPGYNYCGPGTDYNRRIRTGVKPVNALDAAALVHDKYTETRGPQLAKTPAQVWAADKRLAKAAAKILVRAIDPRLQNDCKLVIAAMMANRARKSRGGKIRL